MKKNKYRIGPLFILKIVALVIMFFTAVYAMYYLNTKGIEKTTFGVLLGAPTEEEWKVCSKDLLSFSFDSHDPKASWKLLKAQDHWRLLYNGSSVNLEEGQIKNCMAKICRLKVAKKEQGELIDFREHLNYQFLDMTSLIIRLNSKEKIILWEGSQYHATELINFLAKIPSHHCK